MGKHGKKQRYTFTEWVIGVSALAIMVSLPILLITVVIAQLVIANS